MGLMMVDVILFIRGIFVDVSSMKELYWLCDDSGVVFIEGSWCESMGLSIIVGKM